MNVSTTKYCDISSSSEPQISIIVQKLLQTHGALGDMFLYFTFPPHKNNYSICKQWKIGAYV